MKSLENGLCKFDYEERMNSLRGLIKKLEKGEVDVKTVEEVNMHCHTFFSYNGYNLSPAYIAWWAKKTGLFAAGLVDFDVLDGVDEFVESCDQLDLRYACGMETRVFVSEFADRVINSPGEPGVAYHMGVGFDSSKTPDTVAQFAKTLKEKAVGRTREIVKRVNQHLGLLELDFDKEVVPLTPAGNATERHVCAAYFAKAEEVMPDLDERVSFWATKLETPAADIKKIIDDPVKLQGLIRSKTMKSGGVGYMKPKPENFPALKEMNEFVVACGALPVVAWLDGCSAGEDAVDELLDLHVSLGAVAVNIIPDRNWNFSDPEVKKKKVFELNRFIDASKARDLPIIVGTEMNAPAQIMVDDFSSDALAPHVPAFIDGAAFIFAHTILRQRNMGLNSEWAKANFNDKKSANEFYIQFGRKFTPATFAKTKFSTKSTPASILA